MKKKMRRLSCSVPWTNRERKQCTDGGVEQRGGVYEHGGDSGSTRGNPLQRMLRRATSQRESPVVEDYNLAAGGR